MTQFGDHQGDVPKTSLRGPLRGLQFTVIAACAMVLVHGCGGSRVESGTVSHPPPGAATKVKLDEETGRIVLPLARFGASDRERRTIYYAHELMMGRCMHAQGFPYLVFDRRLEPEEPSRLYGVWTTEVARKYGYGLPPESREEDLLERQSRRGFARAGHQAFSGCTESAARVQIPDPLAGDIAAFNLYDKALDSQPARGVIRAWHECLAAHGIPAPSDRYRWSPLGPRVRHTQRVALQDVRCKQRVDLVERLTEIEARVETRWIERHRGELTRQRAQIERQVRAAKTVIARMQGDTD